MVGWTERVRKSTIHDQHLIHDHDFSQSHISHCDIPVGKAAAQDSGLSESENYSWDCYGWNLQGAGAQLREITRG